MLEQDYIHKVPVILHDNLQRHSHKPDGPPPTVTYLQLLRKLTNSNAFPALNAETHWFTLNTISRTRPNCYVSLGSLTFPANEAEVFMKLVLLYK
jgi:hypothetical protein